MEDGPTLVNLLAYVDLNPIRAGIVKRPEEYKWCSLGYHVQTKNKDDLLCVDFGMKEWNEFESGEIVRKYREFVYETGAAGGGLKNDTGTRRHGDAGIGEAECGGRMDGWTDGRTGETGKRGIDPKIVKKERRRKYKISRVDRFRYRCRYFNDAGVIGSKAFVGEAPVKWEEILRGKCLIRSNTC